MSDSVHERPGETSGLLRAVVLGGYGLIGSAVMRRLSDERQALPPAYHRLYRIWFAFGFPAFFAMLGILWLMLTKPVL